MALNIKSPEADRLARELTATTGESLTTAVEAALRERLERERGRGRAATIARRLHALGDEVRSLPVRDSRSAETILGYDEHGLAAAVGSPSTRPGEAVQRRPQPPRRFVGDRGQLGPARHRHHDLRVERLHDGLGTVGAHYHVAWQQ